MRYVTGWVYIRSGQMLAGVHLLERAKFSYTHQNNNERVVRCNLELARAYQSREQFHTAYLLLRDEVKPLIERNIVTDRRLQADFYLRMAEISPDISQLVHSIDYGRRALMIYRDLHDIDGEFRCLTRLATTAHKLAEFAEAASNTQLAQICATSACLGNHATVRLLNLVVHQQCCTGNLHQAVEAAQQLRQFSDQHAMDSQRVYARILLGNLWRALGHLDEAQR